MRILRPLRLAAAALLLAAVAILSAAPAQASDPVVDAVIDTVALPRLTAFADATAALSATADADCTPGPRLLAAWNAAFDAFVPVQAFRSGPMEEDGIGQAIAYWPDPKAFTQKQLRALLTGGAPVDYSVVSVAARGLFALEVLLYDPDFNSGDAACALIRAASADLAVSARRLSDLWADSYALLLRSAGEPGNTRFLTSQEARQSLLTQLLTQLEFDKDERLGRPLGTLEKTRPARAEAHLSGRSLRNLSFSLAANEAFARALGADRTEGVLPAFAYAATALGKLTDPVLAEVGTTGGRLRVQEAADAIGRAAEAASTELGAVLGVAPGFNALDGD
jgi:uncharacterized protein